MEKGCSVLPASGVGTARGVSRDGVLNHLDELGVGDLPLGLHRAVANPGVAAPKTVLKRCIGGRVRRSVEKLLNEIDGFVEIVVVRDSDREVEFSANFGTQRFPVLL